MRNLLSILFCLAAIAGSAATASPDSGPAAMPPGVTPATINLHAGTSTPVTVHALRRDGFAGPIALSLRDPSGSLMVNGGRIPAGEDKLRFTLTVPPTARAATFNLHLEGHATIGDRHVVHDAVPAEDMMQAFLYRHLVPAHEWKVDLLPPARQRAAVALQVKTPSPLKLTSGGANRLRVQVPAAAFLESVDVELSEPPAGITLAATNRRGTTLDLEFACDATVAPDAASPIHRISKQGKYNNTRPDSVSAPRGRWLACAQGYGTPSGRWR